MTLVFVTTVFLSSYLLFAVQPMVAKFLLPSFGGTAAVWTACLVMFQTLLLAGYTYAHLLRTKLSPAAQRCTHLAVLALSLAALPPIPHLAQALTTTGSPVWTLLRCLLQSIGLPFFALSATAPLLMEWFRQAAPDRPPDRLYAFSNAGSLLALLSYPFVLEPAFTRVTQARLWSGGMVLFFMMCAVTAWKSRGIPLATTTRHSAQAIAFNEVARQAIMADPAWNNGDYYDGPGPAHGLAVARMIGHVTYLSDESMREKFGRRLHRSALSFDFTGDFQVESYLHHQGKKFVTRFDANSLLFITKAADYFDLERGGHNLLINEALESVSFLVISVTSDWLYPTYQSRGIVSALKKNGSDVSFCEIEAQCGHDAFLIPNKRLDGLISGFLDRVYHEHCL